MPTVLGANTASDAYEVANSMRFNNDDSAYMQFTPGSASGNRKKWTWSGWVKRGHPAFDENNDYHRFFCVDEDSNNYIITGFNVSGAFNVTAREGNTQVLKFETPGRMFRDHSSWYHIVMAYDSTQSTARNRFRVYFNGVEDDRSLDTTPNQNVELAVLDAVEHNIGRDNHSGTAYYYDGYMAEVALIDGTQYAADTFGKFDSNGVWVPIDFKDDVTFGTNGFYLEFKGTGTSANASGVGADTSGETNHLTPSNLAATDQCVDTCTNNFAVMNPHDISTVGSVAQPTFSEGNTKLTRVADSSARATFPLPEKGKWYFEVKYVSGLVNGYPQIYLTPNNTGDGQAVGWHTPSGSNYRAKNGGTVISNAFSDVPGTNDVVGFFVNMDDKILIVHRQGSDNMGSGASSGIDFSSTTFSSPFSSPGFYFIGYNSNANSTHNEFFNFGNPAFALSSAVSDANGYGNFEYSPTLSGVNFYSICTKNIAEFG